MTQDDDAAWHDLQRTRIDLDEMLDRRGVADVLDLLADACADRASDLEGKPADAVRWAVARTIILGAADRLRRG